MAGPLEKPDTANQITQSHGGTKDVLMGYRIHASRVPAFMRRLGLGKRNGVGAYGEVQEREEITNFSVDLARYGFRGLYSVYPEWPIPGVTNYSSEASNRFCALIDANDAGRWRPGTAALRLPVQGRAQHKDLGRESFRRLPD